MTRKRKWKKEDIIRLFEILLENNSPLVSHPKFRQLLTRDENLFTNQVTREANGNIAYRTVDFDVEDLGDDEFWDRIASTPYNELIEENAAVALVKMAEKLNILT
ncbi:MAG: hypothetical protein HN337_10055 [Deltaproteobacteria bacterium]|jgi:hypothetical protein|nr:hypothetical protein [Deltaproteobacteria bacterium]